MTSPWGDDLTLFGDGCFTLEPQAITPFWTWRLLRHYLTLDADNRSAFWLHVMFVSTSDGEPLHPILRAQFFQAVWSHERYWDTDSSKAIAMMIVMREICSEVADSDLEVFELIVSTCPYLAELIEWDNDWTDFRLPVDRDRGDRC